MLVCRLQHQSRVCRDEIHVHVFKIHSSSEWGWQWLADRIVFILFDTICLSVETVSSWKMSHIIQAALLSWLGAWQMLSGCFYLLITRNGNFILPSKFTLARTVIPSLLTLVPLLVVKRVEFVSDRMSYIVLRGSWCNIIVLNVHAPNEEKSDGSKDSFYGELEEVFGHFPKYDMKILLGDFNAKVGREYFQADYREWEPASG